MESPERPKKINYWLAPFLGMALFAAIFTICWRTFWYSGTSVGNVPELGLNQLWLITGGTDTARYLYPGPLFIAAVVVIPMSAATILIALAARHFKRLVVPNADLSHLALSPKVRGKPR